MRKDQSLYIGSHYDPIGDPADHCGCNEVDPPSRAQLPHQPQHCKQDQGEQQHHPPRHSLGGGGGGREGWREGGREGGREGEEGESISL